MKLSLAILQEQRLMHAEMLCGGQLGRFCPPIMEKQ